MMKVGGAIGKSAAVMSAMNALVRVDEISGTMAELSKEMMKVKPVYYIWRYLTVPAGWADGGNDG